MAQPQVPVQLLDAQLLGSGFLGGASCRLKAITHGWRETGSYARATERAVGCCGLLLSGTTPLKPVSLGDFVCFQPLPELW